MTQGTRGKFAEGKAREWLKKESDDRSDFNFMRLPDARAGSFQPTTSDYLVGHRGIGTFLEMKEVQHDFRLPCANFPGDQRGRIQAWELAGFKSLIVVCHTTLKPGSYTRGLKMWRCAPLSYFLNPEGASWDMRDLPLLTLDQSLINVLSY